MHRLPETLGNLSNLQELNVCGNKYLKKLPKSICGVQKLVKLVLDHENMKYPPQEVCEMGLEEILKFITEGMMD